MHILQKFPRRSPISLLLATLGLTCVGPLLPGQAATPATAPPQLKTLLSRVDAAANRRNVQGVLSFFSPNFRHADGLTRQTPGSHFKPHRHLGTPGTQPAGHLTG